MREQFSGADSGNSTSTYNSSAAEASKVVKATPGKLFLVACSNGTASTVYLQVFNSTTVPADATVPVLVVPCPANGVGEIDLSEYDGHAFSTGIAICGSTTQNTKTLGGASFLFHVRYK